MSAYSTPSKDCPYCGEACEADWCDVGVGMVQCGPYHCYSCHASQASPHESKATLAKMTDEERKVGWFKGRVSPLANTVGGLVVDHKTAKLLYEMGLLDEKSDDAFEREGEP